MVRSILAGFVSLFILVNLAVAGNYRYVSQEDFKTWLQSGKKTLIVDIQPAAGFEQHHFKGALRTEAFPAKTEEQTRRLDEALTKIRATEVDVVIICPRGGGGAKNTYDYLRGKGVPEQRLSILEKGMDGWPYPELSEKGRP